MGKDQGGNQEIQGATLHNRQTMKNYETGICCRCDKPAEQHHRYGDFLYCSDAINSDDDFKDSGVAQIESMAIELFESLQEISETSFDKSAVEIAQKAINEALKRE